MRERRIFAGLMCLVCLAAGCGSPVPTVPNSLRDKLGPAIKLTGQILVDGAPPKDVIISALNEKNLDEDLDHRRVGIKSMAIDAFPNSEGKFEFMTYTKGDGLPAGNYILLFKRPIEVDKFSKEPPDPSKATFNEKYDNPKTSTFKVTLEVGKPVKKKQI